MECPIVETNDGALQGKVSKATDPSAKPVYQFLGIRYGKSPTGKRRFMPPERSEPWEGVFQAVKTYEACPHDVAEATAYESFIPYKNPFCFDISHVNEDCLKLNIFTPDCNKDKKMPVMVWFTGGAYQRHHGGRIDGTALSGMNDAVVVIPNYRVNAFGFLSLGKGSSCPGNLAILDVILSLKWVKENIEAFGGDPDNVTVFGQSSGSVIVHMLTLTQLSAGLFHKAIMMSGSVLATFLFTEDLANARDMFCKSLGIEWKKEDEQSILETLQSMPHEKITAAQTGQNTPLLFTPTVDGHVIKNLPHVLIQGGHVHPVPLLIGCTNDEGGTWLSFVHYKDFISGITEAEFDAYVSGIFSALLPEKSVQAGLEASKKFYEVESRGDDSLKYSWLHAQMIGDTLFLVPTVVAASAHAALGNPTYLYQMTQRPEFNHSTENGPGIRNKADFCHCDHADDLLFVWGLPFTEGELSGGAKFTDDERELSRNVMRYLVNFAKSGDPNKPEKVSLSWPKYSTQGERPHMILQTPLKTGSNLAQQKVDFHTKQLPSVQGCWNDVFT